MKDHSNKISEISIYRPREDVISHLEKLLEHAKTGELMGMIEICVWHGESVSSGWAFGGSNHLRTMIGELEVLKHDLIENEHGNFNP